MSKYPSQSFRSPVGRNFGSGVLRYGTCVLPVITLVVITGLTTLFSQNSFFAARAFVQGLSLIQAALLCIT